MKTMQFDDLKEFITTTLDELKATDIVVFDVRSRTSITDMMIVCTGNSSRHVKSLANNLAEKARAVGVRPLGIEGAVEAEWVLVDFGDAIVHIMQFNTRELYQLELLWK